MEVGAGYSGGRSAAELLIRPIQAACTLWPKSVRMTVTTERMSKSVDYETRKHEYETVGKTPDDER
jgi:hypothetical protein